MSGIRVTDKGTIPAADDLLVIGEGSLGRQPVGDLASQLAASGAVASALADKATGASVATLSAEVAGYASDLMSHGARLSSAETQITALEAGQTSQQIVVPSWSDLSARVGTQDGQGAEVIDADTGSHPAASATGYDGAAVDNAGLYQWRADWSRWVRLRDTGLSSKLTASANLGDLSDAGAARDHLGLGTAATQAAEALPVSTATAGAIEQAVALRTATAAMPVLERPEDPAAETVWAEVDASGQVVRRLRRDGRHDLDRADQGFAPGISGAGLIDAAGHPVLTIGPEGTRLHGADGLAEVCTTGEPGARQVALADAAGVTELTDPARDGDCQAPRLTWDGGAVRFVSNLSGRLAPYVIGRDGRNRMTVGDGVLRAVYVYGQSLSVGVMPVPEALTATPLFPGVNLMPLGADAGISPRIITDPTASGPDQRKTQVAYDAITQLVDLREGATDKCGETVLSRLGAQLQAPDALAGAHPLVLATCGVGGSSYAWLTSTSVPWANLCRTAHLHRQIARDLGLGFELSGLVWIHGHSNGGADVATYTGYLEGLEQGLADLCTTLGQTQRPVLCTSGLATSKFGGSRSVVPLAQLAFGTAASDLTSRVFAGPEYTIEIGPDGTHPTALGYQDLGDLHGMALRAALFEGGYTPFVATGATGAESSTVTVTLSGAEGAVALDTSVVSDPGGYGFRVYDGLGEVTVSAVTIVNGAVEITLARPLEAGAWVDYALSGPDGGPGGPTSGPRGCLRDSRAGVLSSGAPAHRYLPACTLPIS